MKRKITIIISLILMVGVLTSSTYAEEGISVPESPECVHNWQRVKTVEYATFRSDGKAKYECSLCKETKTEPIPWKYTKITRNGTYDRLSYDIVCHTNVYRNSRKIIVLLKNPSKGATLKIRVGKKKYSKKIRNTNRKVAVKIRKPRSYGQKVIVRLYYKNRFIGKDRCYAVDRVWYGDRIRKGMTKRQVLYTWGKCDAGKTYKNGITIWDYGDGAVFFRNGKVVFFYDSGKWY